MRIVIRPYSGSTQEMSGAFSGGAMANMDFRARLSGSASDHYVVWEFPGQVT